MLRMMSGAALLAAGSAAMAASPTDFGVREIRPAVARAPAGLASTPGGRTDISGAVGIGWQWGRVTSTYRSPAHNRRVGGVRNSYHLSGRAIDIARRPGVSHWQIAAALRAAGYHLVESLDEGDHSHFALGSGAGGYTPVRSVGRWGATHVATKVERTGDTRWRIVFAPAGRSR